MRQTEKLLKVILVGVLIGLSVLAHGFQGDTDQTILARAIFGEARGECDLGKIAVGWVIRNRVENPRWWGSCYHTVILKPWQFSAFNEGDPNLALLKNPLNGNPSTEAAWWDSYEIAGMVLRGEVDDPTGGADHFHSIAVSPWWADPEKLTIQIGRHRFYRLRGGENG